VIKSCRELASRLAQQASVPNIEAKLQQAGVPHSLWSKMRAVIGKHRGYSDAPGLTDERRLGELTVLLDKPCEQWIKGVDDRLNTERMRLLPKHYGTAATRGIDLSMLSTTGAMRDGRLVRKNEMPYLRGLWRDLDQWGADQLGIAVKTLRNLRVVLPQQRPDNPLFASLRPARRVQKPQRHRR
jgi:hypothetical protein